MNDLFSPEEMARYRALFESMPRETLTVFLALRVDGMTYREIKAVHGIGRRRAQKLMLEAIATIDQAAKP